MELTNLLSARQPKNKAKVGGGKISRLQHFFGVMKIRFCASGAYLLPVFSIFALVLNACAPSATPTFFVPPAEPPQIIQITAIISTALPTTIPTIIISSPTPTCTNNLTFNQDVTIPDGTNVQPGQPIDKQWLVTNNGTCNWDSRYHLKLTSGDTMSAPTEQPLFPARAGAQAKLRILFTAPQDTGTYQSAWQAVGPDGTTFGEVISIQVIVGP